MRTRVVTPLLACEFAEMFTRDIRLAARPDNAVDNVFLEHGPASIEDAFDHALSVPETIARIMEAEREGIDAVVINCMGDPGMTPGRHVASIPVIGPFETASHVAASLGRAFSVVTVLDSAIPLFVDNAKLYGVEGRMASVRSVGIPVLELDKDPERMVRLLIEESVKAVRNDGADTIIFGCTGMAGVGDAVRAGLLQAGYDVPVVDPAPLAVKMAELLVDMRLLHSRHAYPFPRRKAIQGFDFVTDSLKSMTARLSD